MKTLRLTLSLCAVLLQFSAWSQDLYPQVVSTETFYREKGYSDLRMVNDDEGNIYIVGNTHESINAVGGYDTELNGGIDENFRRGDGFIAKFNSRKQLLWSTYVGGDGFDTCNGISIDNDGNIIVIGLTSSDNGIATSPYLDNASGSFVVKLDTDGQRLWGRYLRANLFFAYGVDTDANGDIFIAGQTSGDGVAAGGPDVFFGGYTDVLIIKLSSAGAQLWSTYYGGQGFETARDLEVDAAGNFYITGYTWSDTDIATAGGHDKIVNGYDAFLAKFSTSGDLVWGTYFGGTSTDEGIDIAVGADNSVFLTGITYLMPDGSLHGYYDTFVAKFRDTGESVWATSFGGSKEDSPYAIALDEKENVYVVGSTVSPDGISYRGYDSLYNGDSYTANSFNSFVLKLRGDGTREWSSYHPKDFLLRTVTSGASNEIYVAGFQLKNYLEPSQTLNVFISSIKNVHGGVITGRVFDDANKNCSSDNGETPLKNIMIKAEPGPYYAMTDSTGVYNVAVAPGNYTVREILPQSMAHFITSACAANTGRAVSVPLYDTVKHVNFGNSLQRCASLETDVIAVTLKLCEDNTALISVYNAGYMAAENVKIYLSLSGFLHLTDVGVSYTQDADGIYVFDVGSMESHTGSVVQFTFSADCESYLDKSTQCIKAWATATNTCLQNNPSWDKSNVDLTTKCVNGTARVTFSNTGEGNMADSVSYRLLTDAVFAGRGKYKLNAGQSFEFTFPLNGKTLFVEAPQFNHPAKPIVRASLEGCGLNAEGTYSKGFLQSFSNDDLPLSADIECLEVSAITPADRKRVSPLGVTEAHYVPADTEHEYTIYFSNETQHTINSVSVIDTLDQDLEISTLRVGGMSHYGKASLSGKGRPVLTWQFENIQLLNIPGTDLLSNGFVKYAVRPKKDLPPMTILENKATVIFDGSSHIHTNKVITSVYSITDPPQPVIEEVFFSRTSQGVLMMNIEGSGFDNTISKNIVEVNGTILLLTSATEGLIVLVVEDSQDSGRVKVSTPGGSDVADFTVPLPPVINEVVFRKTQQGGEFVIAGLNFDTELAGNLVKLNGAILTVISAAEHELIVSVPGSASSGSIQVTTTGGTASYELLITSIEERLHSIFMLYPNPSRGEFTVHALEANAEGGEIIVTDYLGQVVHRQSLQQGKEYYEIHLDDHHGTGLYFVSVHSGVRTQSAKMVVNQN